MKVAVNRYLFTTGSGIGGAICKCAPRSRHIITPATHHSVFTGRVLFQRPNNSVKALKALALALKVVLTE